MATPSPDALEAFWNEYAEAGRPGLSFVCRRPRRFLRALRAVGELPQLRADPSASAGGQAVAETLDERGVLGVPLRIFGTAALPIPVQAADYVEGRRAQTLRRKIRAAERAGTVVEAVSDLDERRRLVKIADDHERSHPDPTYRVDDPDNDDLLDHDLWLVARDPAGEPLLLSVTPIDGELATLRYFRTFGSGSAQSDARYLMTAALVEQLSERRVRWLLDTEPITAQTSGLRHFQRMLGFGYVRFRI